MTFDQLEMLEAVVEEGSFKAAADALHKSQPSLSVGIRKLEEEFGLQIFDRSDYRVRLTDQGRVFFRWAKESLESFRSLETIAREMGSSEVEPKIVIVIDPLVDLQEIEPIFQACLGSKNPTELTLRSEILGGPMDLLLSDEAHIAIGTRIKESDSIESVYFKTVEMIPVCKRTIEKQYKTYPQIIVMSPDSHGSLARGPKCFVSDHSMKQKLILSGYGWGRMAKHEISEELRLKKLSKVNDVMVKAFKMDLYIMRNRLKPLGPVTKKLWVSLTQN